MSCRTGARKALLCFHGTGSKGEIFNVQMAQICYQLREEFEFIFVDGPIECAAGPGVLPMFNDQGPYRCWFNREGITEASLGRINNAVQTAIKRWQLANPCSTAGIVGAVGFSEGALAVTFMLWQQQQGHISWLPRLGFAVMSCCFFPNEASLWLHESAKHHGILEAYVDVPTLHIHGNRDFCLGRARKLVKNHYRAGFANVIQIDGGHQLPTKRGDIEKVTQEMKRMSLATQAPAIALGLQQDSDIQIGAVLVGAEPQDKATSRAVQ